jgi:4-amino-4-deoxy-L-arabinose transferase-like glycosyltransferase
VLSAQYSDSVTYLGPAHALISTGALLDGRGQPMFHRPPGYPAFLAALMIWAHSDLLCLMFLQALLLSSGPVVLYWLARRVMPVRPAVVAGLIAALSPWTAALAVAPVSDGLHLVLLLLGLLVMSIAARSAPPRAYGWAACLGLVASGAVLVRGIWQLVVLFPISLGITRGFRHRDTWSVIVVSFVVAVVPVALWTARNVEKAAFHGLSDVPSQTAWQYLAARVRADVEGTDRHRMSESAAAEERTWGVPSWSQELDDERWSRAFAVFRAHPARTAKAFVLDLAEQVLHPSPDVLVPARLSFVGDRLVLGVVWLTLLALSVVGATRIAQKRIVSQAIEVPTLTAVGVVCGAVVLTCGLSFSGGSRLRVPLEGIVPLLAALSVFRPTASQPHRSV